MEGATERQGADPQAAPKPPVDKFYLAVYWHGRPLTLRQYADTTHEFLAVLHWAHPIFRSLTWVGAQRHPAVRISPDLTNLDDLICRHAGGSSPLHDTANADGTRNWCSRSADGYSMRYETTTGMAMVLDIRAGNGGSLLPDTFTISFPVLDEARTYREFFNYEYITALFRQVITFWKPETGLVTTHSFSRAMAGNQRPGVGWLTYIRAPLPGLQNDPALRGVTVDEGPEDGVLISLGRSFISANNSSQVEKGRVLRQKLRAERLIDLE
jgi:hypothetical protein